MADREKVLKGLFCCRFRYENDRLRCKFCPYKSERVKKGKNYSAVIGGCVNQLKIDALELLKNSVEKSEVTR